MLMISAAIQAILVAAEDHMAQGHGSSRSEKQQAPVQKKADEASLNLNDSPDHRNSATGKPGQRDENEAQQSRGKGPQVAPQAQGKHSFPKNTCWQDSRSVIHREFNSDVPGH